MEVRLEAVPEMGYDPAAEPPTGEVCIRGPGLFSGYYKQPGLTKECIGECVLCDNAWLQLHSPLLSSKQSIVCVLEFVWWLLLRCACV